MYWQVVPWLYTKILDLFLDDDDDIEFSKQSKKEKKEFLIFWFMMRDSSYNINTYTHK